MQFQLETMYAEKELLENEIGVSETEDIISMIRNLEVQLCDMYERFGHNLDAGGDPAATLMQQFDRLSDQLDGRFAEKSISVEIVDDKPVLRAVWKDFLNEGDYE